jgi:glutamyl-tRNA synthetase
MSDRRVRVRFAPSPTGYLHIGGVRTALYNYLFAKKHGGDFLLRIEDTDQNRYVPGAEAYIMEALEWLGISPVESPLHGGQHAPYRQSERKEMYRAYADQLLADGHAYYAFDTPEELDEMRRRLEAAKVASPQYNAVTRNSMKNSITGLKCGLIKNINCKYSTLTERAKSYDHLL